MKCPHCLTSFHSSPRQTLLISEGQDHWYVIYESCPDCHKAIIWLEYGNKKILVNPKAISRSPVSKEVDPKFANDYIESCLVLSDSPKASAALSRRCLQNILREKAKVTPADLSIEIDEVINSGKLPTHLSDALDAVRNIGNFGAHPIKSRSTGEVVDVEPGEAEWNLEILEGLFDFYFVAPKRLQEKKDALNKKLTEAGKPTI